MKRIGIAASWISKGNLWAYNGYVILLAVLFSIFIFVVTACSLLVGFAVISLATKGIVVFEPGTGLSSIFMVCMVALAVVIGGINLVAILMNIRLK